MISREYLNYLSYLIRPGKISSINPEKHTARVTFGEDDNATTAELSIICRNSLKNKDYDLPDIDEDVLCIFCPGGESDGFIIGSYYADETARPANDLNTRMVKFSDDTTVTYDRAGHNLDIKIGTTSIHADREKVNVNTNTSISLNTSGDININAIGTVTIHGAAVNIN